MKKIIIIIAMLMAVLFAYATQLEIVGEVFSSYSG